MKRLVVLVLLFFVAVAATGCATGTGSGLLGGAAVGAAAAAAGKGNPFVGAIVGGAIGAAGGAVYDEHYGVRHRQDYPRPYPSAYHPPPPPPPPSLYHGDARIIPVRVAVGTSFHVDAFVDGEEYPALAPGTVLRVHALRTGTILFRRTGGNEFASLSVGYGGRDLVLMDWNFRRH